MNPRIYNPVPKARNSEKPILLKLDIEDFDPGCVYLVAVGECGDHITNIAFIDEDGMNVTHGAEQTLQEKGYDTSPWAWDERGALVLYEE